MTPRWSTVAVIVFLLQIGCREEARREASQRDSGKDEATVVVFTDANFRTEVLDSQQPVLVDVWAAWCRPCMEMKPVIKEVAADFAGRVKVGELDVQANQFIAEKYGVYSFPMVLIFRDGAMVRRLEGISTKHELAEALNAAMASPPQPDRKPQ